MPKIAAVIFTDKEAKLVAETLAAAAPHAHPSKKRDLQAAAKNVENAPRRLVS